jgi:DNA-binding CsgD family transcriptional regulator
MPAHTNPIQAQRAAYTERRVKVLELAKAGASFRQIARALNVSHETARKDLAAVMDALKQEQIAGAEELRAMELERLNMAMAGIAQRVRQGDLGAIDRWIKLCESRRKLLGLDAATKVDHRWDRKPEEMDDAELESFILDLRAQVR